MHLIGAPDSYIAQQFQAQSLRLGIVGGVVGTSLAAATLLAPTICCTRPAAWLRAGTLD